jgi:hypothetical protein
MFDSIAPRDGGVSRVPHLRLVEDDDRRASGRHRVAVPESRFPKIGIGLMALAALVGIIFWLTVAPSDRPAPPNQVAALQPSAPAAAIDWMRENLPTSSRVLTDGVAAPVGYPSSPLSNAKNWHDFDYLLTTATRTPPADSTVSPVWQSSTPVALFDGLQVRHIAAAETGKQPFTPADDLAQRVQAGAALLHNQHLDVLPGARPAVQRGELDLRVAAVLSGLAAQVSFSLQDVTPVPVEAAAGTPVRAITIYPDNIPKAIQDIEAFDPALKPDRIVVGEYGALTLDWPLSFAPIPAVH